MPTARTIMLYSYDELGDTAKARARQWWIEAMDSSDFDSTIDDFREIAELLGIDFKTHTVPLMSGKTRQEPNIYWQLGYSQSDFAAFEGYYRYKAGAGAAVKQYAPKDETLHAIADDLQALQKRYFYKLFAVVSYSDYYGLQVACEIEDSAREVTVEDERELQEIFRRLSRWLYGRLRDENDYLTSEEQIADAMEANEYTFREDGTRED